MSKLKEIGLSILFFIVGIIAIPMVILMAIAFFIVYGCFSVFEYIILELSEDGIDSEWDELCDIYADLCECWRDLILDLKMES